MSRTLNNLNARRVEALLKQGDSPTKPGWYSDGGGLYLKIDKPRMRKDGRDYSQSKKWVFVFFNGGKRREMGLGGANEISLKDARENRNAARQKFEDGRDPIAEKVAERAAAKIPAATSSTPLFGDWADQYIAAQKPGWKNAKHAWQWEQTIHGPAASLCLLPVDKISTEDVLAVLRPMWATTNETASRLRGRIEKILDAARAAGHIESPYENPARWAGHLEHFLSKRLKGSEGHQAAVPWKDMPAFWQVLAKNRSVSAEALRFTILTAVRTTETIGATWREIDLERALWIIPKERMKMAFEHVVPLSDAAIAILKRMAAGGVDPDAYIFPGQHQKKGTRRKFAPGTVKPLSNMAMLNLLRGMGRTETVHGFRSSFRDFAGGATEHPRELAEMALAHTVGGVEGAYRRGRAVEKRRALMQDWSDYLAGKQQHAEEPADIDVGAVIAALSEGRPLPAEQAKALVVMLQANSTAG